LVAMSILLVSKLPPKWRLLVRKLPAKARGFE
jgi:hypothetical protein